MEHCGNCNKTLGQYDYRIKVKDGIICTKCYKKLVLTFSEENLEMVSNLSLNDVNIIIKSEGKVKIEDYLNKSINTKCNYSLKNDILVKKEKNKEKADMDAVRNFEQYLNFNPNLKFDDIISFSDTQKKFKTRYELFNYKEISNTILLDDIVKSNESNNNTEVSKSIKVRIKLSSKKKAYIDVFTSKKALRVGSEEYNEAFDLAKNIYSKLLNCKF